MSANDNHRHGKERKSESVVDVLAREAREHWVPSENDEVGDDAEQRLFARIDAYEAGLKKHGGGRRDASVWGPVALITAVAAGVVLFAHARDAREDAASAELGHMESPAGQTDERPPAPARPTAPAVLAMVTGGGELRVDGESAGSRGASLHDGETVESRGGEAVFAAPGRADWLLEKGTEVSAVRAGTQGGAIILALRVGAVEAQVTPVPQGEAFAVDVDGVRVAVHGTHLRVAREERNGTHVVVDLSEGVILVGTPPKAGTTLGQLVYAPAHVEFSIADLSGTLQVDHDPAHVRAPVDPPSLTETGESLTPTSVAPHPAETPITTNRVAPGPRTPSTPAPKPLSPNDIIVAAINRCADDTLHGRTGTITISSVLTVDVKSDGAAGLASFDPPLAPEMQTCVGGAVYATRWNEPGAHRIPIEIHR